MLFGKERRHVLFAIMIVTASIAGSDGTFAESPCFSFTYVPPAKVLADCSRIIADYRAGKNREISNAFVAYAGRIAIYRDQGKRDLALKDIDEALDAGLGNIDNGSLFYIERAEIYAHRGDYALAIVGLTEIIGRSPKYAVKLYAKRAELWKRSGNLDQAIADQTEIIRLEPNFPPNYVARAEYFYAKGEFDLALADHDEAVRRDPFEGRYHIKRAIFWNDRGEADKAKADLEEAMRRDPKNGVSWGLRALIFRDLGKYDQALADYDQAVRLSPTDGIMRASRGEIWRLKGNLDRALEDQNAAVKLQRWPTNLILRGDTHRYRGDYKAALADFDASQKLSGTEVDIPSATGRGLTYEKMKDLPRARAEFNRAVKAGSGRILADMEKSRFETAQARLAALESGVTQPVIPLAPKVVTSSNSLPTISVAATSPLPAISASKNQTTVAPQLPEARSAGRRVALIIGNSGYKNVPVLANPQKDADAISKLLRHIGFESVAMISDTTREALINALRTFANEAENSDWAMVYYAGHGIEVGGVNYLVPVDAKLAVDRDIEFEAVALAQVLNATGAAKKIKLVMLDACRDNPFTPRKTERQEVVASNSTAGLSIASRSTNGRGLAEVKLQGATLVVYAAKDGQVALDGEGGNSPFAVAVVQRIATPGVEINKIFRLVRDDVMEATAGRQEPFTYGSLPGREDFFFVTK